MLRRVVCSKCGKEFETLHRSQRFCQDPCKSRATYIEAFLNRKPNPTSKQAPFFGQRFNPFKEGDYV